MNALFSPVLFIWSDVPARRISAHLAFCTQEQESSRSARATKWDPNFHLKSTVPDNYPKKSSYLKTTSEIGLTESWQVT